MRTELNERDVPESAYLAADRVIPTRDSELQDILARSIVDTPFFCQTFMPETYRAEKMTYQHRSVWQILDDERVPKACACCWRGWGKSTSMHGKAVKNIVFRLRRFKMFVGPSFGHAAQQTEDIKGELLGNQAIRDVFGNLKSVNYDGQNLTFGKESWFASDPKSGQPFCFVVPKGAGQRVRGAKVRLLDRAQRPDFINIDDLEEDEEVDNEELRRKLRKWFNGALLNCIETDKQPNPRTDLWHGQSHWRIFYMDTLKHEDANIAHILQSSDWRSARFPLCELRTEADGEREYYSLVPELVSHEQVRRRVYHAKRNLTFDEFVREMMCLPIPPEDQCWTQQSFQYYSELTQNIQRAPNVDRFIIVDPAKTANMRSAYSALLAVGADCEKGAIYLRRLINKRMRAAEVLDQTFGLALATNSRTIAVEITGLEDWIVHQYENEAKRRNLPVEFLWLKAKDGVKHGDYGTGRDAIKRARAAQILPYYENRYVYHEERLRGSALEQQQLSYPKCTFWDAIDCSGYIPKVLHEGGRYFLPQPMKVGETRPSFGDGYEKRAWDAMIRQGQWQMS